MKARAKAVIAVVLVWMLAGIVIFAARATRPTTASVLDFLRQHDPAADPSADRREFVAALAGKMNRLRFEEREEVKSTDYVRIYRELSPREKEQYLLLTLATDLRQTFEAMMKLPPERRLRFLDQIAGRAEWYNVSLDEDPPAKDRVKRLAESTLRDYVENMSPAAMDEVMPGIERMKSYLRMW